MTSLDGKRKNFAGSLRIKSPGHVTSNHQPLSNKRVVLLSRAGGGFFYNSNAIDPPYGDACFPWMERG